MPALLWKYIEFVVLGVAHHMRGKHVERNEVSHPRFFANRVCLLKHIRVYYVLPWHEIMLHLFIGVQKLHNIFTKLNRYRST